MPAPSTGRDLHVDVPLSNVTVGRRPEGYIADLLLPITPVGKQSDTYYKFNHLENRRNEVNYTRRAPGTEARQVHMTVSSDTFFAPNYALKTSLTIEDEVNADQQLAWSRRNAEFLTDRLLMDYELRVAALANNAANVSTTVLVTSAWSSKAGSDPLEDFLTYIEGFRQITSKKPNTVIIPESVMRHLRTNNSLRSILFGDRGGVVNTSQLAELIGVKRVLVPTIQTNTAVEADPQGGGLADVWGNKVFLGFIDTFVGDMTDTWANAFRWTSPMLGVPWAVQRHPFDPKKKVMELEVGYYQDEKIVSSDLMMAVSSVI